jgi:hypothetical protein
MRNPERTLSFLTTAAEIEGEIWCDETQMKYQALLIKNRYYTPTAKNLSEDLYALITDFAHELTYAEAREIFDRKNYVDPDMRGRTSFDPLEKMGLVSLEADESGLPRVRITDFGRMFIDGKIDLGEMVFANLLKAQYPNPLESGRGDYNLKPFVCTLRLIKRVNELCVQKGEKAIGISREEFGVFVLSLKSHRDIDATAERILDYRHKKRSLPDDKARTAFRSEYIAKNLANFQNAEKNIREYTDNMIRYLRLTKYIYIRGGGYYIDLEPRRMIEINAILEQDNGAAREFTLDEYKRYISDYNAYVLPFETESKLKAIAQGIIDENAELSASFGIEEIPVTLPETRDELKSVIEQLRERRTLLQNLLIKRDYSATEKIDEAIKALNDTLNHRTANGNKPSIELEKWANVALNILNDATLIKPNSPLGDDNEPTFTAPAKVPDIECYYNGFGAICEVTMLTGRDQWYNEGQPVMRHLREFETVNGDCENYCLFVAPRLHTDTVNTFWTAVKYEYEGRKQKIVPITITGLIDILNAVKNAKAQNKAFHKDDLRRLYDKCVDITGVSDSTKWAAHVGQAIEAWANFLMT